MHDSATMVQKVPSQGRKFKGNRKHLQKFTGILREQGIEGWNRWRKKNNARYNLEGIDLSEMRLGGIDLSNINLKGACFTNCSMWQAQFNLCDLNNSDFERADTQYASFYNSNLSNSRFVCASLILTNFRKANLSESNLSYANISGSDLRGAKLNRAYITGVNTWAIAIDKKTEQDDMIMEPWIDPLEEIVDDTDSANANIVLRVNCIETAHLLYLFTRLDEKKRSEKVKIVTDGLTEKLVLILGNFSLRRKAILKAIRNLLAEKGYVPMIFDFDPPEDRDLIESVAVFAGLSKFVIADLTAPSSTPLETLLVISGFQVPFAPIIQKKKKVFSMFHSLRAKYNWVLSPWIYKDRNHLIKKIEKEVILPCEKMRIQINNRRRRIEEKAVRSKMRLTVTK